MSSPSWTHNYTSSHSSLCIWVIHMIDFGEWIISMVCANSRLSYHNTLSVILCGLYPIPNHRAGNEWYGVLEDRGAAYWMEARSLKHSLA